MIKTRVETVIDENAFIGRVGVIGADVANRLVNISTLLTILNGAGILLVVHM